MTSPKSFILNALLKPLAKNPPNGPMMELNRDSESECRTKGYVLIVCGRLNCDQKGERELNEESELNLLYQGIYIFIVTNARKNLNSCGK